MGPPQREVLFAYFNFSLSPTPPSTRGSLCLVDSELNEHSPPQREVLFAYFNFSLSPPPPSTRASRCIVEKFVTPLKEKFSLPISIFHSLLPHPQREVLFVSLTVCPPPQRELLVASLKNLSPPSKRSSLCLFQFFTLSYPTLNERFSLPLGDSTSQEMPFDAFMF